MKKETDFDSFSQPEKETSEKEALQPSQNTEAAKPEGNGTDLLPTAAANASRQRTKRVIPEYFVRRRDIY